MIKLLLKSVSDKIAAGEVVERPSSVVKELVENSIDSGATSIIVEIKKGGSSYIRVTDNGSGIPKDEVELAFTRHATSKISTAEDLDNMITLGFRGEALASIAAVSITEIITKTSDKKTGTKVILEAGKVLENKAIGAPDGTTVIVEDLFFNTPARRKFMKSNASESNKIIDLMKNIALAYPKIKIRMVSNDSVLFSTPGTGERLDVITTLSGRQLTEKLIVIDTLGEDISLEGYVSGPGELRSSRKEQIFFVNGRVVDSKVIEKAIAIAYKERLFEGRYPIAYLFIEMNPNLLDVNIHPNKREVRFDDDEKVISFLSESIKEAIIKKIAIPEIDAKKSIVGISKAEEEFNEQNNKYVNTPDAKNIFSEKNKIQESFGPRKDIAPFKKESDNTVAVQSRFNMKQILSDFKQENELINEKASQIKQIIKEENSTDNVFDDLRILTTIFDTYIICADDDAMYLIDQHAAHERIHYEEILNRMKRSRVEKQSIMIPITFTCIKSDEEWILPLENFGFTIEEFGPSTYVAKEIPTFFNLEEAEVFLKDYISEIDENTDFQSATLKDRMATKACKAAVKAHDHLKDDEIATLIKDLEKCENPYSCPHGRPTFIKLSRYEIEKKFNRIV